MPRSSLLVFVALFTACDEPADAWLEEEELEESEPADLSRTKDQGGANGDYNYCDGATPCNNGEGDCDSDAQCAVGLVCGNDNGAQFGLNWARDTCVASSCQNGVQDGAETGIDFGGTCGGLCGGVNGDNEGYCSVGCPCAEGEGDCDSNSECDPGLSCFNKQGDRYPGTGVDELDGVCIGTITLTHMQVGDVIVTEIMSNPAGVGDAFGEWFEIFNTTQIPIDLNGLEFRKTGGVPTFTLTSSLVIQPRSYMVFARNGNAAQNGGVTDDFDYINTFGLGDTVDSIVIDNGPLEIDRVAYNATFPNPNGASQQLDIRNHRDTDNNIAGNWCTSTTPFGAVGDESTPGTANTTCP